jgi:hypothetical protein
MSISRRPILKGAASAVVLSAILAPSSAQRGLAAPERKVQITGRIVQWTGEIPRGWIGGNAEFIEKLVRDQSLKTVRPLLEWLLSQATKMDAVLAHFFDLDTGASKTPPVITVNEIELDFVISDRSARTSFQERLRGNFVKDELPGTQITTESERTLMKINGYPSYSWSYRIKRPDEATYYAVFHLVDRGISKAHVFTLKADGNKYQMRRREFDQLLSSVRYVEAPTALRLERVRAVLTEEDTTEPRGRDYPGWARWRTDNETISPGHGRVAQALALRADVEVPERKLAMTWLLFHNSDKSLPGSHIIEMRFNLPVAHPGGGIFNILNVIMKHGEKHLGVALTGHYVKINDTLFVVGLSETQEDTDRNIQLLKERNWFEIGVVYNNKRPALIVFEKGAPGEEAFEKWGSHKSL